MKTDIKILQASCCSKGSPIKSQIETLAAQHQIEISIEELSALQDTMVYGTTSFPSLVVNGKVYDYKQYQSDAKLLALLQ